MKTNVGLMMYHKAEYLRYKKLIKEERVYPGLPVSKKENEDLKEFLGNVDLDTFKTSGERQFVELRAEYIKKMRKKGYTFVRIGKIIGRSHSSVLYLYNKYK